MRKSAHPETNDQHSEKRCRASQVQAEVIGMAIYRTHTGNRACCPGRYSKYSKEVRREGRDQERAYPSSARRMP